jgi:23S rRNA pseudouridine955/2504/2580 synthase
VVQDSSKSSVAPKRASDKAPQVRFETVTEKNVLQRVDNFLLGKLKGVPKSKIYSVIRKGEVRINKKRCKPDTKLSVGDVVRIPPVFGVDDAKRPVKLSASLSKALTDAVLYEDKHVLAVNKPSGLAVHGGSGINLGLIEALRTKYPEHQFLELVHRLDRDTSGVILIAKSRMALRALHAQFRDDKVNKTYHLAVHGKWPKHQHKVEAPLRKNELKSGERIVVVAADGKPSQTYFRTLSKVEYFSLVEAKPVTGRTHQIRVHSAFCKCPIVGDDKYIQTLVSDFHGMEKSRLMLHARQIEFTLPTSEQSGASADEGKKKQQKAAHKRIVIEAPYDNVFERNLRMMGLLV